MIFRNLSNFSAAHCILEKHAINKLTPEDVLVLFGTHDISDMFEVGKFGLSPWKIHIHEEWNPSIPEYDADLSLLEFEKGKIFFNIFVQPVCLWDSENEPKVTEGKVSGYGQISNSEKKTDGLPRLVNVLIQSNEYCLPGQNRLSEISSNRTFCAGRPDYALVVCCGYSGSGLFVDINGVSYLRGIVSSALLKGDYCDTSKNAFCTNILKFRDWIGNITGGKFKKYLKQTRLQFFF